MNATTMNGTIGIDSPRAPLGDTAPQLLRSSVLRANVPTAVCLYKEWGTSQSEALWMGFKGYPVTKVIWSDGRTQYVGCSGTTETLSDVMDVLESKGIDGEFTVEPVSFVELCELEEEEAEEYEAGVSEQDHDENRDYRYCF